MMKLHENGLHLKEHKSIFSKSLKKVANATNLKLVFVNLLHLI